VIIFLDLKIQLPEVIKVIFGMFLLKINLFKMQKDKFLRLLMIT